MRYLDVLIKFFQRTNHLAPKKKGLPTRTESKEQDRLNKMKMYATYGVKRFCFHDGVEVLARDEKNARRKHKNATGKHNPYQGFSAATVL